MPSNPNIIIEIGDRFISSLHGETGYGLRAVVKFTHIPFPALPSGRNKFVQWIGPLAAKNAPPLTERGGEWETADAAYILRKLADILESPNSQSADRSFQGDLLAVMAHDLKGA